jgi:tRNA nucleotidyltransferase (CCA-adding enzyme)
MGLQIIDLTKFISRLPFDFQLLPPHTYLVGGTVRDVLLSRFKPNFDLDFVLPEAAISTAKKIADYYRAGFVVLDEARQIARVVLEAGTLDFALQVGKDITIDLQRRDFTINAIAYDCSQERIIDPLGGVRDLENRVLRMIARDNLIDDPLRLLRAYRQAAQLDFTIAESTRSTIRELAPLIAHVSAERVQAELNYLLVNPIGDLGIQAAQEDNLLEVWLPNVKVKTSAEIKKIELTKQNIVETWHNLDLEPDRIALLAKLSALVSQNPEQAREELAKLKYSRAQIDSVVATVKYLPQLLATTAPMSLREQYQFFVDVKPVFPILMIRAIALEISRTIVQPLIDRYLDPQDPIAHPQPLVTGNDLIAHLNLKPSPAIGKLLTEIQIAYIEGKISTFAEAIEWARAFDLNE